MNEVKIGDIIPFGEYDWRVLDVREGKALIITESVVEQRAYNVHLMYMTWEMCRLREYLNGEFLNKFDVSRIAEVTNPNPDNLWCETEGGNPTQDKIFLLSLEEVDKYFGNSGDYLAQRRKSFDDEFYLDDDGIWVTNNHDSSRIANYMGETCWWWLRSPGDGSCWGSETAAYVTQYGSVLVTGEYIRRQHGGVRPALWLKLCGGNEHE
jgi:hypothetical protein